ncbi:M48 family metallopeptidase [Nitrospirillum sp. BR 11828]|uniref:M48 family metallopeptidase n=1 Tax=Nitrospirillum sp. BR 11828 TaxID=3104325 RepID=UPI002ACA5923|nr:M48 family metallopeptidase [Nitrospirillum sp. BR 11828]MDZ5647404.1 M48 family metallopeptidase [Nitrospirillum sp. BR 11828]
MTQPAMAETPPQFTGRLVVAGSSRAVTVPVTASAEGLHLGMEFIPAPVITIVPPVGGNCWRFRLADGRVLEMLDGGRVLAETLGHREGWRDRLEKSWRVALLSLPVILAAGAATWFWGVPLAADQVADMVPLEVERSISDQALQLLLQGKDTDTKVPLERQKALQRTLAAMVGPDNAAHYWLSFLNSPIIGPNAFALPGGDIVVTDQLVDLLDDEEIAAVLAHEVGHVQHRHGLRMALRASGMSVLAAATLGDMGSAGQLLLATPVLLTTLHYTRGFEAEADAAALAWLTRDGRSPCAFARALRKIVASPAVKGAGGDGAIPSWLRSHPMTEERLRPFDAACPAKI